MSSSSSIRNCCGDWLNELPGIPGFADRAVTRYPTLEEIIAAHEILIHRFGGTTGIRDRGALESAVARPQSGYYSDVIAEAAALWESLSQNHPFLDGNKRIAITATAAFLRMNGYKLEFNDTDAYRFLIGLFESGSMRFSALENWLLRHAKKS